MRYWYLVGLFASLMVACGVHTTRLGTKARFGRWTYGGMFAFALLTALMLVGNLLYLWIA